ncbi:hypothetical protein KY495_00490 [Massilia sp. PAMC28688]|uniref:hypothetical protein n=1 Tax=Massilia sp. PAMC28688 TaxID=2861283 RepID=UPI001C629209|nr:hypothetical protein [Massilia sp. PAMC28688]QYF93755.1 hypothetical protein KY495_00490 [Massilia sp. PAMC28688]
MVKPRPRRSRNKPPDPAWVKPFTLVLTVGLAALFITGLRDLIGYFIEGQSCMGRHCNDWASEPWGFIGHVATQLFFLFMFGGLLVGCTNVLKHGLQPPPENGAPPH